jgi:hypothetical protein
VNLGKDLEGSTIPVGLQYRVLTQNRGLYDQGDPGYRVIHPHVTGVGEILEFQATQKAGIPMNRAFDVNLQCFTSILHGCRDFAELAPSAWADHERQNWARLLRPAHALADQISKTGITT